MRLRSSSALLAILLTPLAILRAEAPAPPTYTGVTGKASVRAYVQEAINYIKTDAPDAKKTKVMLDMAVLLQALQETDGADRWKFILLSDYPRSIEANFVASTFTAPKQFAEFAMTTPVGIERSFVQNFEKAQLGHAQLALNHFKDRVFESSPEFLIRSLVAAKLAQNKVAWQKFQAILNKTGGGFGEIDANVAKAALGGQDGLRGQIDALEKLAPARTRNLILEVYLRVLEKGAVDVYNSPEIRSIRARLAMDTTRPDEAIAQILRIPTEQRKDRDLFTLALARTVAGQEDQAARAWTDLKARHADSEWTKAAEPLAGAAKGMDARYTRTVEALTHAAKRLRTGFEQVEARAQGKSEDGRPIGVYASYDRRAGAITLALTQDGELRQHYAVKGNTAVYYSADEKRIYRTTGGGLVPALRGGVKKVGSGYSTWFNFQMYSSVAEAVAEGGSFLDSEVINSPEGLGGFLGFLRLRGKVVGPIEKDGDRTTYTWWVGSTKEPKTTALSITLIPDGTPVALASGGWTCAVRYGSVASPLTFDPPKIPDHPVTTLDGGAMTAQLLKAFAAMMKANPKKPAQ